MPALAALDARRVHWFSGTRVRDHWWRREPNDYEVIAAGRPRSSNVLRRAFALVARDGVDVRNLVWVDVIVITAAVLLVSAEDREEQQEHVQDVEEDRCGQQRRRADVLGLAEPLEVEQS